MSALPPLPKFQDDVLLGQEGTFSQFWYDFFYKMRNSVQDSDTSVTLNGETVEY